MAKALRRDLGATPPWLTMRIGRAVEASHGRAAAKLADKLLNGGATVTLINGRWDVPMDSQPGDPITLTLTVDPSQTVRVPPGRWRVVGTHGPHVTLETFDAFAARVAMAEALRDADDFMVINGDDSDLAAYSAGTEVTGKG